MAEKQTNKERLKDITDSIETGIKELFESDKYRQYLATMSRFHKYSVNNTMLIYMQRPDATHVAGFNKWRDQFGRSVKKGEKGIKIIAPTPFKKKIERQKLDPDTKLPLRDENGDIITEEKTVQIPMYKPVVVFDVQQTAGKPLPELAANLTGDVQNYEVFIEALRRSAPVPIFFEKLTENMDGYFSVDKQHIVLREGMSEVQTVCAAVHEIAHSKLHNKDEIGEKYQAVELFGKPALFSNGRIDRDINNGPKQTVAELEEQAKSGKPVSLMELAQAARREQAQASRQEKKPSVLAKLCPPVNESKKTARSKRAERELL